MRRYHSFPWVFLVETCRNPWALCGSKFQTQKTCWNINFWAAKVWLIAIAFFCQTETQSRMLSTRSIPRSSRFATLAILGCYSMQNATFGLAKWVIPKISLLIIIWLVVWNIFLFFHILGIIIPTDSYFSEGLKPPTRYISAYMSWISYQIHRSRRSQQCSHLYHIHILFVEY